MDNGNHQSQRNRRSLQFTDGGSEGVMAEAAVENPAASFFCHRCRQEIGHVLPDYTCPQCQSGFIEELVQGPIDTSDETEEEYNPISQIADLWNMLYFLRAAPDSQLDPTVGSAVTNDSREARNVSRAGPSRHPRSSLYRPRRGVTDDRMRNRAEERFLQNLVSTISGNPGLIANTGVPVFVNLHSNPGDYAWGRGGWNAIINQLINHLDITGPPPLPSEKINEIPSVEISQEQVDKNLQCTVCMEDFKLNEPVRRLSCEHNFHDGCIIPWLQLHGTCPICRKLLNEGSQESFPSTEASDTFMTDVNNPESSDQTSSMPDSDNLSPMSRSYNTHQSSVYDFTDEFD